MALRVLQMGFPGDKWSTKEKIIAGQVVALVADSKTGQATLVAADRAVNGPGSLVGMASSDAYQGDALLVDPVSLQTTPVKSITTIGTPPSAIYVANMIGLMAATDQICLSHVAKGRRDVLQKASFEVAAGVTYGSGALKGLLLRADASEKVPIIGQVMSYENGLVAVRFTATNNEDWAPVVTLEKQVETILTDPVVEEMDDNTEPEFEWYD